MNNIRVTLTFMPPKLTPEQKAIREVEKKEYYRRYYATHRAEQIEESRQWRANNPDRCRQQDTEKRSKDGPYSTWPEWKKERHRAYTRRFRAANPDKVAAAKEKTNARRREKYQLDANYREQAKAASRLVGPEAQRDRRARLKRQVFDHYGAFCACCGETEEMFLTLGHVNQDGAQHRRAVSNGSVRGGTTAGIFLDVIRRGFPDDFRIECYNCNCGSYRNGGVCPHEHDRLTRVAPITDVSTGLLPCAPEVPTTAPGLVT